MPKIPTYLSGEDIKTGSTGPQASAPSFGVNPTGFGQGLANLGGEAQEEAYRNKAMAAKHKKDDERQWMRSAGTQLERVFAEFAADEKNRSKETFADDFNEFARKETAEYQKAAPSTRASIEFRTHADGLATSYWKHAATQSARNKEANGLRMAEEQTGNALLAYRQNVAVDNPDAADLLQSNVWGIFDDLEERFSKYSPDIARKAQEQLVREVVLATAKHDPELAKTVLNKTNVVGEPLRKTLLATIESDSKSSSNVAKGDARRLLDRMLNAGQRGQIVQPINESVLAGAFDAEQGAEIVAAFNDEASKLNQANAIVEKLSDKNAGYQQAQLAKLSPDLHTDITKFASQRLEQIEKQQQQNPAGFMRSQNSDVQAAYERGMNAPDSLKAQYLNIAHGVSLRYQGYPPVGASKEEAAKYLSLPTHARHILSAEEAAVLAGQINQGAPSEQLDAINNILAGYDEEAQFIAFNDLVTLPKGNDGIPPAIQLAFLNQGKTWVKEYMSAALSPETVKSLTPEKSSEFSEVLDGDSTWQSFVKSMYAGGQRAREIGAWRSGIIAYANSLASRGQKAQNAVETSLKRLIGDNFGFPNVHGQPVMVQKVRRDGTVRHDDEVSDYGRRMQIALRDIDPREIKQEDDNGVPYFMSLPMLPDQDDPLTMQHLRDIITSQGFYRPSPDGQSVSLHLLDDDGVEFQVRDKNNQPFEIDLDDLPKFTTSYQGLYQKSGPAQPKNTYDIVETVSEPSNMFMVGARRYKRTNWPTTGGYFKRQQATKAPRITDLQAP
jgi:hypothetical protein